LKTPVSILTTCVAAALATMAAPAAAAPANPAVEGPVEGGSHGRPFNSSLFALQGEGYDYTEREYFFRGTANHLPSGRTASYKTRMLVRLPRDPGAFSGIVVVEWLNVTAQYDLETAWPVEAEYLMRNGVGFVGVSAQQVGVCCGHGSLTMWDRERYGSLSHPGDDFSWDIFSQATQALREPGQNGGAAADPMGGLKLAKLVATGGSQSASRLTTFVNDGYNRGNIDLYVITRGGGPYRDFSTPIFNLNEENLRIPQEDNERFVGWEEAGTAHAPAVWNDYSRRLAERDLVAPSALGLVSRTCSVNRGSVDYSARALSHWTAEYFRTGKMPPSAPRMERDANGNLVRDANGLAKGGLRHPFVEVPVALNSSERCPLWGHYEAWSNEKIRSLYPTHCDYVTKVRAWADQEIERGWLLAEDRDDAVKKAVAFGDPWGGRPLTGCPAATLPSQAGESAACTSETRIRVSVSPRSAPSGKPTRFRFRVTRRVGSRNVPVARARIRFAGRTFKTNKRGRATRRATLRRGNKGNGRYRVSVVRAGLCKGRAHVTVT
jgi:hypothetical protein